MGVNIIIGVMCISFVIGTRLYWNTFKEEGFFLRGLISLIMGFPVMIASMTLIGLWCTCVSERRDVLEVIEIGTLYDDDGDYYVKVEDSVSIEFKEITDVVLIDSDDSCTYKIECSTVLVDTVFWGGEMKNTYINIIKLGRGQKVKKIDL